MGTTEHTVHFSGATIEVTVTNEASKIKKWVKEVSALGCFQTNRIMGLDCEWKPNTTATMNNKAATLQLCTNTKCLIVQLLYLDYIPETLKGFLGCVAVTCVGVQICDDVSKLRNEHCLHVDLAVDIQARAMSRWLAKYSQKPGLKTLGYDVVGLSMEKPVEVCRSNWEARVLSEEQIRYACIDAYVCFRVGKALLN